MRCFNVMAGLQLLTMSWLLVAGTAAQAADYEIVARSGDVEFRRYPSQSVVEASIHDVGDFEQSGNQGFRLLAGYVRGENDLGADLPVSAPVLQSSTHLQFILAGNGHRDTLPRPKDTSIQVRSLPQRMIAALRYSGNWSEARFRQNARRLLESLERDGIDPLGEARFARYNAPFVPGFARRNEVLITVTRLPPVVPAAQIASRSQQ